MKRNTLSCITRIQGHDSSYGEYVATTPASAVRCDGREPRRRTERRAQLGRRGTRTARRSHPAARSNPNGGAIELFDLSDDKVNDPEFLAFLQLILRELRELKQQLSADTSTT